VFEWKGWQLEVAVLRLVMQLYLLGWAVTLVGVGLVAVVSWLRRWLAR